MTKDYGDFTVLVSGAGTMGHSMALVMASNGIETYMASRHPETLDQALSRMEGDIKGLIENGMADEGIRDTVRAHLHPVTNDRFAEVCPEADVVFETVIEDPDAKRAIYEQLNASCRPDCIIASNTSGMDVFTVSAGVLEHPERFMIAHWFNPPHLMKLVEVVRGDQTGDAAVETMTGLLRFVGRKPAVLNKFVPGFIVNRLATVINRELYYMIDQGWISGEDAESAIRYTHGLRFGFEGPLALWDFVGLEIPLTVARGVLPTLCNATDQVPLGEKLIAEGKTGVAVGEGVLTYPPVDEYVAKRSRRILQMTKIIEQWDEEDEQR